MATLAYRLAEIERRLANIVRMGVVQEVDADAARVRVAVGTLLTAWIPWMTQRAGAVRTWDTPTVGEQVLVVSPGGDMAQGLALPAVYRQTYAPPSNVETISRTEFDDGAVITYDRAAHKLTAVLPAGSVEVEAPEVKATASTKITLIAPTVEVQGQLTQNGGEQSMTGNMTIIGNLVVQGTVTATTDVMAGTTSLKTHVHGGVLSGGNLTAPPV